MAVSIQVSGAQVATVGTEHILAETGGTNDLPVGKTYELNVDTSALIAGDTVEIRPYVKARAADAIQQYDVITLTGVQISPGLKSIPVPTAAYCKFTLKQTAGTSRTFPWAVYAL